MYTGVYQRYSGGSLAWLSLHRLAPAMRGTSNHGDFQETILLCAMTATATILGTTGIGPFGIAIDKAGNVYTANLNSNNVSKITPDGTSTVLGTTGNRPYGIAIDGAGNVYTANSGSNNVSKITPSGISTILATSGNPSGPLGVSPRGIAIDGAGNVYTSNYNSNNVSKITPDGTSTILGTTGTRPAELVLDEAGNVYTANSGSNNVSKISPDGTSTILGATGNLPTRMAIDGASNVYTANFGSNSVSKITPDGTSTILGTTSTPAERGQGPYGIAIDDAGNVYTANNGSNNVSKITPDGTSTIFGTTGAGPNSLAIDAAGNVYTSNISSNDVSKISPPLLPTASEIQVTETYIGLLDRAPDRNGLAYWVSQLNRAVAAGQEATFAMKKLTNDIALSPEWTAGLGTNNVTAQVGANTVVQGLYQNLFERAQTQADLDYWTPQLTGGSTTASEMALNLITAAKNNTERPTDGNVLGFKREAGSYYVQNVPQANYTVSTARNAVKDVNDAGSLADSKTATNIVKAGRLVLTSYSHPLQPANFKWSSASNAANDVGAPSAKIPVASNPILPPLVGLLSPVGLHRLRV